MLSAHPSTPILDRALALLAGGPQGADVLVRDVMGLPAAPAPVAARLAAALLGADPRVSQLPDGRWAMVSAATGSRLLDELAFAVVDVETTGLSAERGRVIEVGVVVVQGTTREIVLDRLVNPGHPLPPQITAITRLTDHDLRDAPAFHAIADEVVQSLSGRVFVAHNARFDWSFIATELKRSRGMELSGPQLCTARLARRLVPDAESCGLDGLSTRFNLENPARHRAVGDAWATAGLLLLLLERARGEGARTLEDLAGLQAPRMRARLAPRRAREG